MLAFVIAGVTYCHGHYGRTVAVRNRSRVFTDTALAYALEQRPPHPRQDIQPRLSN